MGKARYTADEVLAQLDAAAGRYDFPMLDNGYIYPGDVRLTAYRDDARWAILIEALGYHYKAGFPDGIYTAIYAYGNALRVQPGSHSAAAVRAFDCAIDPDNDYPCDVPPDVTEVLVRGQPVPIPRKKSAYKAKGIALRDTNDLFGQHVLRVLLPEHREALLATEEELARCVAPDLPRFLRLSAWYHPDLGGDELPSGNVTFQKLAESLVAGDPNRLRIDREPNTHWTNWPHGGAL